MDANTTTKEQAYTNPEASLCCYLAEITRAVWWVSVSSAALGAMGAMLVHDLIL